MEYKNPPLDLIEINETYAESACSNGALPQKVLFMPILKDLSANTKKITISPQYLSKKILTLTEIQEIVCYNYVKRSIFHIDEALSGEKLILFDKLIHQIFYTINYVYSHNKTQNDFEIEFDVHPLFDWRKSIPEKTPSSISNLVEEMSNNKTYKTAACKVALIYEYLDILHVENVYKMCKNYRQHILDNLYNEVYNEVMSALGLSSLTSKTVTHIETRSNDDKLDKLQIPLLSLQNGSRRFNPIDLSKILKTRTFTARLVRFRKKHGIKVKRFYQNKEILLKSYFRAKCSQNDGWNKENSKTIHTFYRKSKDGMISIKLRCKLPIEFMKIICIMRECDLAHHYVPFLKYGEIVKAQSRGSYVIHHVYDYPIVGLHDMLLYFIAVNALEESNSIFFVSSSPAESLNDFNNLKAVLKKHKIPDVTPLAEQHDSGYTFLDGDLSKVEQNNSRQKAATIFFSLFPIYEGKYTVLEIIANVIASNAFVPTKLVSYISLMVAKGIVKEIYKLSRNFNETLFEARMRESTDFYIWCGNLLRDLTGVFPPGVIGVEGEKQYVDDKRNDKIDTSAYINIDDISLLTYDN